MTDTATGLVHVFPKNVTISKQVVVLQRKEILVPVKSGGGCFANTVLFWSQGYHSHEVQNQKWANHN